MRPLSSMLLGFASLAVLLPHMVSLRVLAQDRDSCNNPDAVAENASSPATMARSFDKLIGTAQMGARYQFRPEQHYVSEGAQVLLDAGFTSYKFRLQPEQPSGTLASTKQQLSMLDLLKSSKYPYQTVLDMPFKQFHILIGSHEDSDLQEEEIEWYQQVYDLAHYIITRYKGSGKTFYLAAEAADFQIRTQTAGSSSPAATLPPIDPERQELLGKMWWEQQAAVDDAKVDAADEMHGVQVYSYIEVNLMKNDNIDFTVIDDMIPIMDPVPDYVSVSLSHLPDIISNANPTEKISALLDHVSSRLPAKEGISGPRVLVGDLAFPLRTSDGAIDPVTSTQELQAQQALAVAAACVAWGAPAVNHAALYDSTTTTHNTAPARMLADTAAAAAGVYQDRGVGLISQDGKDTVLYTALKKFVKEANAWLETQIETSQSLPCKDHFTQWAVEALVKLANDVNPTGKLPVPAVNYRYGCDKKSKMEVM